MLQCYKHTQLQLQLFSCIHKNYTVTEFHTRSLGFIKTLILYY